MTFVYLSQLLLCNKNEKGGFEIIHAIARLLAGVRSSTAPEQPRILIIAVLNEKWQPHASSFEDALILQPSKRAAKWQM